MSPLNETLEGAIYSFFGWLSEYCNRKKIRPDHWPNCVMVNRWSNNEVNPDPHSTKRKSQSLNFHQCFSIHKAADDFIAALAAVDLSLIVNLSSNRFWLIKCLKGQVSMISLCGCSFIVFVSFFVWQCFLFLLPFSSNVPAIIVNPQGICTVSIFNSKSEKRWIYILQTSVNTHGGKSADNFEIQA